MMNRDCVRVFGAILPMALVSAASATTFFANYQPSLATPATFNDVWPGFHTTMDTGSLATLNSSSKYTGWTSNIFGTQFFDWDISTRFTVSSTFTATHITIPVTYYQGTDAIFGVGITEINPATGLPTGVGSSTRVRPSGFRTLGLTDLTVPFGNNVTGSAANFTSIPITFQPGMIYELFFNGRGAGSIGGYYVQDSLIDGPSTSTTSDYVSNSNAYQPAFALNDGLNSVIPTPGTVALLGLGGAVAMRRSSRRRGTHASQLIR